MMKFVYDDGGRSSAGFKGSTGDCVVRSVTIATQRPYLEIYNALSDGCRNERRTKRSGAQKQSARAGVHVGRKWFKDFMASIGWIWTPTMHIGSGCTVHLNDNELPSGRLIVSVSKHYTAVIDGVIHDIYNPSERGTTIYPLHSTEVPKGSRLLSNGNGWAYSPERCVYGYWRSAQ